MTFTLHVDGERWRDNVRQVVEGVRAGIRNGTPNELELGDIVPVAKGNGYGLGNEHLAREAARIGVPAMAVGTPYEVDAVAHGFNGDIVVLQPWDPRDGTADIWQRVFESHYAQRVIVTISSATALRALTEGQFPHGRGSHSPARIVVEGLTSVRRFGISEPELDSLFSDPALLQAINAGSIRIEGLATHLPLTQPEAPHVTTLSAEFHDNKVEPQLSTRASGRVREAWGWALIWLRALSRLEEAGARLTNAAASLWLSHLDELELAQLREALPRVPLYARVGTTLWHGDYQSLVAKGTVLAVHEVSKGRPVGYRQRRAPADGLLLVIAGGTSHGVALSAPSPVSNMRQRMSVARTGALELAGRARSPFSWNGKHLWFAEPPHMHVSLIWITDEEVRAGVSQGLRAPSVGDEFDCRVRHTTCAFDRVIGL